MDFTTDSDESELAEEFADETNLSLHDDIARSTSKYDDFISTLQSVLEICKEQKYRGNMRFLYNFYFG